MFISRRKLLAWDALSLCTSEFEDFGPRFLYRIYVPTNGNLLKDQPKFMEISKKNDPIECLSWMICMPGEQTHLHPVIQHEHA